MAVATRIRALFDLVETGEVDLWVVSDGPGGMRVHPAVMCAAALATLAPCGQFEEAELFAIADQQLERLQSLDDTAPAAPNELH
jgi:hypothetical protein